jgi:hypothetical protein
VTKTTFSVNDTRDVIDALQAHFVVIYRAKEEVICYTTQNHWGTVKKPADSCDLVLMMGSPSSSNYNWVRKVIESRCTPANFIDSAENIRRDWVEASIGSGSPPTSRILNNWWCRSWSSALFGGRRPTRRGGVPAAAVSRTVLAVSKAAQMATKRPASGSCAVVTGCFA